MNFSQDDLKILLADSEDLVRAGFRSALEAEPGLRVVAEARTISQALRLAAQFHPDVIVVEFNLQRKNSAAAISEICNAWRKARPAPRVIVLTSYGTEQNLFESIRAGASGFLLKGVTQAELVHAVRAVAEGDAVICPKMTRCLLDRFEILPPFDSRAPVGAFDTLSSREIQVLSSLAVGRSNQEIAVELQLTTATVKSHVSRIFAKLELQSRVQAALFAYQAGLVRPMD